MSETASQPISGGPSTQQSQPTPSGPYTIQQGDTLYTIAKRAYGDDNLWQQIYIANADVIGKNPNVLTPGTNIFILPHPQQSRSFQTTQFCLVNVPTLNIRANPTVESAWIASFPEGTTLNFHEVVEGEVVHGNPYWGHSIQNHYYWMGGTDRPNG